MAKKVSLGAVVLLVVIAAALVFGNWVVRERSQTECGFCQRSINPKARVVAEVGGRRRTVCCAHCAVTEGRQENKQVRLIEVTDYNSGATLNPEKAWFVDGSRIMACTHDMAHMDESKHAGHLSFDRCSPGSFAFASRREAEEFKAAQGGVVHSLAEMLKEVQPK